MEDRSFRSVSLSCDLLIEVEKTIQTKKTAVGEALLPNDFKSVAAFVAESVRLRLQQLQEV